MARKRSYEPVDWALPRTDRPATTVKSAVRVLQVLEFIDDVRRPVNLTEIAEALDLPQSSAFALLHTLEELGYLYLNRHTNSYVPTCRLAMLGTNAAANVLKDGALIRLLREIQTHTTQHVILGMRTGSYVQFAYTMQATASIGRLYNGMCVPLPTCGTGIALLSAYPNQQIWGLLAPLYADPDVKSSLPPFQDLLVLLARVREDGYVYFHNTSLSGAATLAMMLPITDHGQPLAIGVGGRAEVLDGQKDSLRISLQEAISRYMAYSR